MSKGKNMKSDSTKNIKSDSSKNKVKKIISRPDSNNNANNKSKIKLEVPPPPPKQSLFESEGTPKRSSSSKIKFSPSLAAAMLSLPWPPPDNPNLAAARLRDQKKMSGNVEESSKDSDGNAAGIDKKETEKMNEMKLTLGTMKPKASAFRKLYKKKSCCCCSSVKKEERQVIINGDPRRKLGDPYMPVTVPPFGHVHTAWPGFDHAPLANWKKKYLVAKPYPYHQRKWERTLPMTRDTNDDFASNALFSRPSELDILDTTWRNRTGRSLASTLGRASSVRRKQDGLSDDENKSCSCSTNVILHERMGSVGGCCRK